MDFPTAMAAGATLVSLAFALSTLERWLARRRPHELVWTVSLLLFCAASATLLVGVATGWSAWSFRLFYLLGAILNVPYLALGTVYLLGGRRVGDRATAVVTVLCSFAAGVVVTAPMHGHVSHTAFPAGSDHFGVLPRVFAGSFSGLAALVIFAGAIASAVRLLRARKRGEVSAGRASLPAGRLAAANLAIAAGVLVISAKALFERVTDPASAFSLSLLVGIALIFGGFLLTNVGPAPAGATTADGSPPPALTRGGTGGADAGSAAPAAEPVAATAPAARA